MEETEEGAAAEQDQGQQELAGADEVAHASASSDYSGEGNSVNGAGIDGKATGANEAATLSTTAAIDAGDRPVATTSSAFAIALANVRLRKGNSS